MYQFGTTDDDSKKWMDGVQVEFQTTDITGVITTSNNLTLKIENNFRS